MTWRRSLPLGILFGVLIAIGMFAGLNRSEAAEDGGTIIGQVLWCTPLPYGVDFTDPGVAGGSGGVTVVSPTILPTEPLDPTGPDSLLPEGSESFPGQLYPLPYPYPTRLIPAGAVLVAVQGTTLSARTGEDGQFTIDGVPVGPFFTVAAGPVAGLERRHRPAAKRASASGRRHGRCGIAQSRRALFVLLRSAPAPG